MIGFCKPKEEYQIVFSQNATKCIANVTTKYKTLCIEKEIFPVTINNSEYNSSYVCSPYTACISYCKEEMHKLKNKPLEFILNMILFPASVLLKSIQVNKIISINNYLLSTNLYPDWKGKNLKEVTSYLLKQYPQHAIMFRSLNYKTNSILLEQFAQEDYILFPSRQVYIFDKKENNYLKHQNTKRDLNLLQKTTYKIMDNKNVNKKDYARIVELYNLLYLEKYSYLNPQFTEKCIEIWHSSGFLYFQILKNTSGKINGVIGYFEKNNVITAPIVGYDTQLDQKEGLYRILMALAIDKANKENKVLNLSSGASSFKILRGGQPHIEYSAIYIKHLPFFYRVMWKMMQMLFQCVGVPLLKKYKL